MYEIKYKFNTKTGVVTASKLIWQTSSIKPIIDEVYCDFDCESYVNNVLDEHFCKFFQSKLEDESNEHRFDTVYIRDKTPRSYVRRCNMCVDLIPMFE